MERFKRINPAWLFSVVLIFQILCFVGTTRILFNEFFYELSRTLAVTGLFYYTVSYYCYYLEIIYFLCAIVFLILLSIRKCDVVFLIITCVLNLAQIFLLYFNAKIIYDFLPWYILYTICNLMVMFLAIVSIVPQMAKTKEKIRYLFILPAIIKLFAQLRLVFWIDGDSFFLTIAFFIALIDVVAILLFSYYLVPYHKEKMKMNENKKDIVYEVEGARGRNLQVYEDKCIIIVKPGIGSFITGNITDGEKTIYYADVIGVQFKKSGLLIGYLQLETASSTMNNRRDNFFNENAFTFDKSKVTNEKMEEIATYIKTHVERCKNTNEKVVAQVSNADELKKFKDLLDSGVITKEEFDAKKKQILGL